MAASREKRDVTVWRPSVPSAYSPMTHKGAACDAASVHFGLAISRPDILNVLPVW